MNCNKIFYCQSRYANLTKYCSNTCLQAVYRRRVAETEFESLENNESQTTDNQLNTEDMDSLEKILNLKDEVNELKTKLLLQERDLTELTRIKSDLSKSNSENEDLRVKLEAFKDELDEYKVSNAEISGECIQLEKKCKTLTSDRETLILANIILQSRELPDFEGRKIKFSIVEKYLPDFKFKESQSFTIPIWHWVLSHKAGDDFIIITNAKKA